MLKELLSSTSVSRVQGLLQSRYGTGFKVDFLMDAKDIGGSLRIPIFSGHQFLAQAMIDDPAKIPAEDVENVSHLIRMVMEPALKNWVTQNQVESLQNEMQIPGRIHSLNLQEDSDFQDTDIKDFGTASIFLNTTSELSLRKFATEIHDLSGRWAMAPLDQISNSENENLQIDDLTGLGSMTLLVNDVLALSESKKSLIEQYLSLPQTKDQPLLILGASQSLAEIESNGLISKGLMSQLQKCLIEVDRFPQTSELMRESLELFLEPEAVI